MNNQQKTPLEKLISDRHRLQRECATQEQELNADFSYIQENAGTLLLSGVSSTLISGHKKQRDGREPIRTGLGNTVPFIGVCRLSLCSTRIDARRLECRTPDADRLGHPKSPKVDHKETFREKEIRACLNFVQKELSKEC